MAGVLVQADTPAAAPTGEGYTLSSPRITTLAPRTYFFATTQTTYDKISEIAPRLTADLETAMRSAAIAPRGAPIFVYKNAGAMGQPFTLEIGCPVADGTQPVGQYQVVKLDGMRSMTAIFTGPVSKIGQAYEQLFPQITAAGESPATERRERYLYWENPESPNNVILIEIGLQPAPAQNAGPNGL
jgi:effector-binding domain-containing protein